MNYRADIDGLRAIAIILVLIYHGGLSFFPSGFIGVDVFFVISGFLISSIIHQALTTHSFSFTDFYNRRIWRLQPVFIALLVLTTALTLCFFLPDDLIHYSKSARKTALFLSNLFFAKHTSSYFAPETQQLPLLHTWSLSIEWQCYLLLPGFIYGLHRLLPKKYPPAAVAILTLMALLYSLHHAHSEPAHSYYLLVNRVYEFLIGSCIALLPPRSLPLNRHILNITASIALLTLFYIASLNPGQTGYPDEHALAVCLACGMLITLGRYYPNNLGSQLLSLRPLVFIGLLSYSLYIWHWVIFSLFRYQHHAENTAVPLAAYLLTFILAYLSWNYIEKPAQQFRQMPLGQTIVLLLLLPAATIHLAASYINANHGFPQRFGGELASIYQQLKHYERTLRPQCISDKQQPINNNCLIGTTTNASRTALMIGDSFANHYWGFMDVLGKDAQVSLLMQSISSCITLPGIYLYNWWHFKNQTYQSCHQMTQKYYQLIQKNHYDYVILGQLWENYLSATIINSPGDKQSPALSQKRLSKALDNALAAITATGAKPILIKSTARMQHHIHDCFFKHIKLRTPYHATECNFPLPAPTAQLEHLFTAMQQKYPQLIIIDPKAVQCAHGICQAAIDGIPVYRDVGHITDYASYQLGALYLQQFANPLRAAQNNT